MTYAEKQCKLLADFLKRVPGNFVADCSNGTEVTQPEALKILSRLWDLYAEARETIREYKGNND